LNMVMTGGCRDTKPPAQASDPLTREPAFCNVTEGSGGEEGYLKNFAMGQNSGSFVFRYNTQNIPDRIVIYDGAGTGGKVIYKYEGSTKGWVDDVVKFNEPIITVEIFGMGSGTKWDFVLNCP